MYEVLDDTAAQTILAIESGDSIRRVAQHLHTPYETVRQAVNRLEDAGYVTYDDGLTVVDERVRDAARELVAASAGISPLYRGNVRHPTVRRLAVQLHEGLTPSTYGLRAATRSVASPTTIHCSSLFVSRTSTPGRRFSNRSTSPPHSSDSPETGWTDRYRSS